MHHYAENTHLGYEATRFAMNGGRVSLGSIVRLGGAAALALGATRLNLTPEMRYLVIAAIGMAAASLEVVAHSKHHRPHEEKHGGAGAGRGTRGRAGKLRGVIDQVARAVWPEVGRHRRLARLRTGAARPVATCRLTRAERAALTPRRCHTIREMARFA